MITRRELLTSLTLLPAMAVAAAAQSQDASGAATPDDGWRLKPFMLEDVNGTIVDDSSLLGKFSLVFFGYTSCQDVCPTTLLTIGQGLKALGADADKVIALFVSLDPDRDNRKVLSDYVAAIDPHIVALRGPKPYIDAMTTNFGVTYKFVTPDPAKPKDYSIDHTAAIFFIGPDGALIKQFSHTIAADQLASQIRTALAAAPKP